MGQDQREEEARSTPMQLEQEQRTALSQAGRAPAAVPVGLETDMGRSLSRVREAGGKGKLFPHEDRGDRAKKLLLYPSLEGFQTSQDNALSLLWAEGWAGDLARS